MVITGGPLAFSMDFLGKSRNSKQSQHLEKITAAHISQNSERYQECEKIQKIAESQNLHNIVESQNLQNTREMADRRGNLRFLRSSRESQIHKIYRSSQNFKVCRIQRLPEITFPLPKHVCGAQIRKLWREPSVKSQTIFPRPNPRLRGPKPTADRLLSGTCVWDVCLGRVSGTCVGDVCQRCQKYEKVRAFSEIAETREWKSKGPLLIYVEFHAKSLGDPH